MLHIKKLRGNLSHCFNINKSRMDCLCLIILSMVKVRTVNLSELAQGLDSGKKLKTKQRRLQRFFEKSDIDVNKFAIFIIKILGLVNARFYLAMDRTNWKYGEKNINILLVSIVCSNYAIPLYWTMLNKRGNSNYKERNKLFENILKIIDADCIAGILADREFIGPKWFKFLYDNNLPLYIRLRKDLKINVYNTELRVDKLFSSLKKAGDIKNINNASLCSYPISLQATINEDEELMVIASNTDGTNNLAIYKKRWEIETMFGFFKTKGFNFESTHITDMEKIKKMVVVIGIAYVWSVKAGEWLEKIEPIKIKKHGRKEISIFRYGLDFIREILLSSDRKIKRKILMIVNFLALKDKESWSY